MRHLKYLLIFSLSVYFSYSVPLVFLNSTSENIEEADINGKNSTKLHPPVKFEDPSLRKTEDDCNCGNNSILCVSIHGIKKCTCAEGYVEINGMCQSSKCDCGQNSISCVHYIGHGNKCKCKGGFTQTTDARTGEAVCKECVCGKNSESCYFNHFNRRICWCKSGYVPYYIDGSRDQQGCKRCDCGEDGLDCYFTYEGLRLCSCGGDSLTVYHNKSGETLCKKCNCGPFSVSCTVELGEQKCTCIKGSYPLINSKSQTEECAEPAKPSRWKLAAYIVPALLLAVIIVILIIVKLKRKRMISQNEGS